MSCQVSARFWLDMCRILWSLDCGDGSGCLWQVRHIVSTNVAQKVITLAPAVNKEMAGAGDEGQRKTAVAGPEPA